MRALQATMLAIGIGAALTGCASGERAQREREIAALRNQLEEIRKGQDAHARELARLSGELKALDAQSAFVLSEVKASSEERGRVKAALEESNATLRALQSTVDALSKAPPAPPASPPAAAPSSLAPDASPEQLYAAAMTSLKAEDHAQAVLAFRELTKKFPEDPLASSAQYWVGEAYYRQREFQAAMVEFRKVIDGYPTSPEVPEALLKIGLCHRAQQDQARARTVWEQVVKEYPGTNAAGQARSLLATLGGAGPSAQ